MRDISNSTLCRIGVLSLACIAATQASAQLREGNYGYGGISVGRSESKPGSSDEVAAGLGAGGVVTDFSRDRNGTGYKVYVGWQLDRNFALEGGYFDLGKSGYRANTLPVGSVDAQYQVEGLNFDLVGTLPLGTHLSALGRIGVVGARTRVRFAQTGAVAMSDVSERSTSGKLGLGLQYAMGSNMLLRGEIDSFRVRDARGGHVSVHMVSLGLVMPFGYGQRGMGRAGAPYVGSPVLSQNEGPVAPLSSPLRLDQEQPGDAGAAESIPPYSARDCGDPKTNGSALGCSSSEMQAALAGAR